jgi:hypothetical protein
MLEFHFDFRNLVGRGVRVLTREIVVESLLTNDHYVLTTARALGIGRGKLSGLISKYKIDVPKNKGIKPKWKIQNDRINSIYYKMVSRCYNLNAQDYPYYGGRGIKVCKEWRLSRDAFAGYTQKLDNWDNLKYSLDRIDNLGDYCPGNVKFSTKSEQGRNRRSNSILTLNGKTYTAVEFSEIFGLKQDFIKDRLMLGFTPDEILNIPKGMRRNTYYKNKSKVDESG